MSVTHAGEWGTCPAGQCAPEVPETGPNSRLAAPQFSRRPRSSANLLHRREQHADKHTLLWSADDPGRLLGPGRLAGLEAEVPKRALRQRRLRHDEPTCSICILEETGEKKKEKEAKVETLWVPAVNNEGVFGRWRSWGSMRTTGTRRCGRSGSS